MYDPAPTNRKTLLRPLVEAGVFIAIAQLLSYVTLFHAPFGGSITAASMLPVLFFAVRWGPAWGIGAGVVYGLLQFLLGVKYPAPMTNQVLAYGLVLLLDFIAAFGVLGLAGFFKGRRYGLIWGCAAGISARFAMHFVSGLLLWHSYADPLPPWLYSLSYNGVYMSFEFIICAAVALVIAKPLEAYITGRDITH